MRTNPYHLASCIKDAIPLYIPSRHRQAWNQSSRQHPITDPRDNKSNRVPAIPAVAVAVVVAVAAPHPFERPAWPTENAPCHSAAFSQKKETKSHFPRDMSINDTHWLGTDRDSMPPGKARGIRSRRVNPTHLQCLHTTYIHSPDCRARARVKEIGWYLGSRLRVACCSQSISRSNGNDRARQVRQR